MNLKSIFSIALFGVFSLGVLSYLSNTQDYESNSPFISNEEENKTASTPVSTEAELTTNTQPKLEIPGVSKTSTGIDFDPELKDRLKTISEAYEEKIQFPSFSLPIDPEELNSKYLPDIAIASELPANFGDPNSPSLSIKTNQFRYFPGDTLTVTATISGLDSEAHSEVSAHLLKPRQSDAIAYAQSSPHPDNAHHYVLEFNTASLEQFPGKQELIVQTEFMFEGKIYQRATSVEFVSTMSKLEDVSNAHIEEDYLVIPIHVSTEKNGIHRVRANLYDKASGTPLVHLRAEDNLANHEGILELKAHITALKESGSEGPYELRDVSLQRLPSKPDFTTEFGKVELDYYDVEGYSFSEYLDKPYINEKSLEIAAELRRISS